MPKKSAAKLPPRVRTPEPKSTHVVCTMCGLDWKKHTEAMTTDAPPTAETCIALLLVELAARPKNPWQGMAIGSGGVASYSGVPLLGNTVGKAQ